MYFSSFSHKVQIVWNNCVVNIFISSIFFTLFLVRGLLLAVKAASTKGGKYTVSDGVVSKAVLTFTFFDRQLKKWNWKMKKKHKMTMHIVENKLKTFAFFFLLHPFVHRYFRESVFMSTLKRTNSSVHQKYILILMLNEAKHAFKLVYATRKTFQTSNDQH